MEICIQQHTPNIVSIETISEQTGAHPELVIDLERAQLICRATTDTRGRPAFDDTVVCEVRKILHLHTREHLSFRMIRHIVRLTRRLERAEAELRVLRERRS